MQLTRSSNAGFFDCDCQRYAQMFLVRAQSYGARPEVKCNAHLPSIGILLCEETRYVSSLQQILPILRLTAFSVFPWRSWSAATCFGVGSRVFGFGGGSLGLMYFPGALEMFSRRLHRMENQYSPSVMFLPSEFSTIRDTVLLSCALRIE